MPLTVHAQIIPDTTLPTPSNVVPGCTVCTIDGGTLRGNNLFHSFTGFSVPTGGEAIFNNLPTVEHIFSRVTGNAISDIDGLIRASGNANVFFINPNGIVFGPNAQLDIGGSFLASTADALQFDSHGVYSATSPEAPALLTINPSALWFSPLSQTTSQPPVSIVNRGRLSVLQGQSLILLGGNASPTATASGGILIDGGAELDKGIIAPGAHVELAAMAGPGVVDLDLQSGSLWRLRVPDGMSRADIVLNNRADVNTRADGGGSIVVSARNLSLAGASRIRTGIAAASSSGAQAGDIEIDATRDITLVDGSFISNSVLLGSSDGGNTTISANSLSVRNDSFIANITSDQGNAGNLDIFVDDALSVRKGSFLATNTFSRGNSGNISIQAGNSVFFDGISRIGGQPSGIYINAQTGSSGNGGSLNLTTGSLSMINGAQVTAITRGAGDAGEITINARDTIALDGFGNRGFSTGAFSSSEADALGQPNNINVSGRTLILTNGATLGAQTDTNANGGNINVNVNTLVLSGGSQLVTTTFGNGNAGNIAVNVTEQVTFAGSDPNYLERIEQFGLEVIGQDGPNSGLFARTRGAGNAGNIQLHAANGITLQDRAQILASTTAGASGRGGSIGLRTSALRLQNRSSIAVNAEGTGIAGDIQIQADNLLMQNQGNILAETALGNGGDLDLEVQDVIVLRDTSRLSTTAGTAQSGGNGGNITIDIPTGYIVAVPQENSDITANAFQGRGGNITITAQGLFGIEPQAKLTPQSDITASSELGVSGTIQIAELGFDPGQNLAELPNTIVDVSSLIAQGCDQPRTTAQASQGEFFATGRGGVTPDPTGVLGSNDVLEDLQPPSTWSADGTDGTVYAPIVEAQAVRISDGGQVSLVAAAPSQDTAQACWR